MYSEWASLQDEIQCDKANQSVLHKFPTPVGTTVATSVVRHIAVSLSITANSQEPCQLDSDKEVKWAMEVLCYGLGLPLTELDTIKECVNVYCNWLTACMPPSPNQPPIPPPIRDDPDPYIQDMIHHLLNLFVPRPGSDVDSVRKQAVFCHRVLRQIQAIAKESTILSRESWETLLKFLLAANDSLLSPPLEKDDAGLSSYDIGDQLCERVLSVLFEIWLLACHKCFPSPSLWKTFRGMCISWRHHESLVVQWHKVNHALTANVLSFTQGPDYPKLTLADDEAQLIPTTMTYDCIAQCWFRFLHIIQNPVDLCRPEIIGKTHKFMQAAMNSDTLIDPTQHECLQKLPVIFYKAMKGVSVMVNAFLGIPQTQNKYDDQLISSSSSNSKLTMPPTPPGQRKSSRPMSVFSSSNKGSSKPANTSVAVPKSNTPMLSSLIFYEPRQSLAPTRPKCDSILHLFGAWLFDAALARVKFHNCHRIVPDQGSIHSDRRSSSLTDSRRNSVTMDYHSDSALVCDNTYEMGRAEALGTLCRIFCAHKTGETILPVYYSRFYLAMYYGLQTSEEYLSGQVLASVLFNSCDILRVDLDGVLMLLPHILDAIQLVLNDLPNKYKSETNSTIEFRNVDLQKACINLLLTTLCLPLHFKDLTIRDIVSSTDTEVQLITFISLKKKIIDLIIGALRISSDSTNTQMLLGGLMLLVEDMAVCEAAEQTTFQPHDISQESENQVFSDNSQGSLKTSSSESSFKEGSYHRLGHPAADTDSAHGLFGEAVTLICHRLLSQWKTDLNSALAAMEILAGLAKLVINPPNLLMCKCTVKWICEFIVQQCNRPAPAHSKDLHSTIVAAFRCLSLWLVEHSRLLYDKECLHVVLEVVELGISGSKSQKPEIQSVLLKDTKTPPSVQNRASDPPKYKQDKQRQPASKRVQEAAEGLLTCIIQHVGAFPPPCGPESLFSLLDEKSLLKYTKGNSCLPEHGSPFRYYVLENAIVVGLLEQPLGNIEDLLPTVTALIRGPFGRHAWVMQLRHSPRIKRGSSKSHLSDPGRPMPMENVGTHHNVKPRNFPESVDKVTATKAEKSIPTLESLVTDEKGPELNKLKSFIEKQGQFESQIGQRKQQEVKSMLFPNQDTECKPPKITEEFQAARLFLSHYGFLSLEALKEQSNTSLPPSLVTLDTTNPGLTNDLEMLDTITARDNDTVHVFYVKSGQRLAQDILRNVGSQRGIQSQFLEFLHSLGWPVDVQKHAGWTGHISTSWKISQPEDIQENAPRVGTGGSIYDGQQQVLYWADVSSEVAFVVPSLDNFQRLQNDGDKSPQLSVSTPNEGPGGTKPTTLPLERPLTEPRNKSMESPSSPHDAPTFRTRRFGRPSTVTIGPDTKIFVVWLENFEDHENFPTGDLLPVTSTGLEQYTATSSSSMRQDKDIFLIYIHALQNGLFRIHMEGNTGRISMAIPLVDGMVVSRRTLGSMVRQTAINIGRRKRLESDSYQPPHVRRKIKIQEIVDKYHLKMTESEFYTALFQDVHK